MRKIYSLFLAVLVSTVAYSQTILYHENFEQPSGADSIASSGNPGWSINTTLAFEGTQSYHTFIAQQDTSYATTNSFSATGNNFVLFSFGHIAKISFFDVAIVQISFDSLNWTQLTTTNTTYIGGPGSTFGPATQNKFTATTYPLWSPGNNTLIPDNSWWRVETFDISALAANMPQVWLRFKSYDLTGDGGLSNYGWLIDSITVIGYECDPALTSGTAASSRDSICNLADVTLTLTNSHGNIQWLESFDNGVTWNPVTGPGSNSDTLQVNPAQSVQYAAVTTLGTCVSDTSNILSIHVEQVVAPTTTGNSRCGIGNVTLSASGNGILNWYDAQTGGNLLDTGSTYEPYITNTTTFYVASVVGGSLSPSSVTVGTGNLQNTSTSYPTPYGNFYWGAKHQFLILASEMAALGANGPVDITSLAFDVLSPGAQALQNFEIKIGHTTTSSLSTWETGLTSVYLSPSYSETVGWNIHNFSSPFSWNGTDNIVVETCFNNSSWIDNAVVNQTTTSFVSTIYANEDQAGVCTNPSLFIYPVAAIKTLPLNATGVSR